MSEPQDAYVPATAATDQPEATELSLHDRLAALETKLESLIAEIGRHVVLRFEPPPAPPPAS